MRIQDSGNENIVGATSWSRPASRRSGPGGPSHIAIAAILLTGFALAQPRPDTTVAPEPTPAASSFRYVDITLDSGAHPLAAYQFELSAPTGRFTVVGIEGGEHPAFREAPYYDPGALAKGRIVIAAFNTGTDLPTGRTRIARVHVQIDGVLPEFMISPVVTASKDGEAVPGRFEWKEGGR